MARLPGMARQPGRRERFTHGSVEPRGRAREMGALGRDFQVQQGQLGCNVQRISIVARLCPRPTRRPRFPIPSLEPFPGPPLRATSMLLRRRRLRRHRPTLRRGTRDEKPTLCTAAGAPPESPPALRYHRTRRGPSWVREEHSMSSRAARANKVRAGRRDIPRRRATRPSRREGGLIEPCVAAVGWRHPALARSHLRSCALFRLR